MHSATGGECRGGFECGGSGADAAATRAAGAVTVAAAAAAAAAAAPSSFLDRLTHTVECAVAA